ncbi:MAG: membrane protein insertion efficiency factor YidD [Bdellovibrionales bacterium]|nr:membrane protein insertion efficiency factor YidD [Bdellovibrionales bacterium]
MSFLRVCWRVYRLVVFPILHTLSGGGAHLGCRHEPSCSVYALHVIEQQGWLRGGLKASGRVLSCHPWGGKGN